MTSVEADENTPIGTGSVGRPVRVDGHEGSHTAPPGPAVESSRSTRIDAEIGARSTARETAYPNLDQRLRFELIARVLDAVLPVAGEDARVLDLGSGPVDALGDLLGPERVTRADLLDLPGDDRYVRLDPDRPLPLPFGDDSHAVVIASEVLEHVPAEDRGRFVRECLRVASVAVIFTHPHGDPRVVHAESIALRDYEARNGREHPYLLEHRDFGLPSAELAAGVIEEAGRRPVRLMNAALDAWLAGILVGERLAEMAMPPDVLDRAVRLMLSADSPDAPYGAYRVMTAAGLTADAETALQHMASAAGAGAGDPAGDASGGRSDAGERSGPPVGVLEAALVHACNAAAGMAAELIEQHAGTRAHAEALSARLAEASGRADAAAGDLARYGAEIARQSAALQAASELHATLMRRADDAEAERDRQGAAASMLETIVARLREVGGTRRGRISTLIERLRETRDALAEVEMQHEQTASVLNEAREEHARVAARVGALNEQIEAARTHARETEQRLAEANEQLAHTRNALDYAQKGFESASSYPRGPGSTLKRLMRVGPWHGAAKTHGDLSPTGAPNMWATSTGGGHFVLGTPDGGVLVRIRVRMQASQPGSAAIRFDTGHGFDPTAELRFPHAERGIEMDRIVRLDAPLRVAMLQPLSGPGEVRLDEFSVRPASRAELAASLVAWRFRAAGSPAGVVRTVRHAIRKVQREGLGAVKGAMRAYASGSDRYASWMAVNDPSAAEIAQMREESRGWASAPLISVLTPIYNTPEALLREMVESVRSQAYENWELICVDDCSPAPEARRILAQYAKADPRIRLIERPVNGNISAATNDALDAASGDYIALLDHDDVIYPHALYSIAREIVHDPGLDWVYSDEDKLYPDGTRRDPFFKPDWSPFYLTSCMYTCHLTAYRASIVREVGGFRSDYDGAQDYDLALRMMRRVPPERIRHVADILYSWRLAPGSTALSPESKPWAYQSIGRTLNENLGRWSTPGHAEPGPTQGFSRARFPVRGNPVVSLVIPTASGKGMYGNEEDYYLARLLRSVRKLTTYENLEIIAVDNDDMPADLRAIADECGARVLNFTKPFNLATKINEGAWAAKGEHVVLLNDDIEVVTPDWIERMLEFSQQTELVGAVGARLLFPDGKLQHTGCVVLGGNPGHAYYRQPPEHPGYYLSNQVVREFTAVTGAVMMCPAETYRELGGFDESFPLNYNDVDFCLRLRERGLLSVQVPDVELIHHEGVSKSGVRPGELERFHERWLEKLPYDPHHNPNLSTHSADFELPDAPVNARLRRGAELERERTQRGG